MSGAGHGTALYARGHVGRAGPIPLRIALAEMEKSVSDSNSVDDAWSAAGVAVAIAEAYDEARAIGGRAIVDVTFALHTRLGLSRTAPPTPFIQLVSLDPYMEWLAPRMAEGSPWRPIVARWVEVMNERLTMHRYSDRDHRRRQARDLIAAPLAALAKVETTPELPALIDFAERALAFYDLLLADAYSTRGWNRIDLPGADQIGGFYGLADEARPPDAAHLGEVAKTLAVESRSIEPAPIHSDLDSWRSEMLSLISAALDERAKLGGWPNWLTTQSDWLTRWKSKFFRSGP